MIKSINIPLAIVMVATFTLIACIQKDSDRHLVARVGDKKLFLDEIVHTIPNGAKESDSIFAVRTFADNWIRQQLILQQAENNIDLDEMQLQKQLNDYRNALLIHAYEEALINQHLDTSVTEQEIRNYYEEHKEDFVLKDNILKVLYVKLYRGETAAANVRKLLSSNSPNDRMKLASIAKQSAANYYLDDDVWLYFNDLLKEIPIVTYNQEAFLTNNRTIDFTDSIYHYLVAIRDFRVIDNIAPLSMEKGRIRFAIINSRKTALIEQMSKDIYERAKRKNSFETYY